MSAMANSSPSESAADNDMASGPSSALALEGWGRHPRSSSWQLLLLALLNLVGLAIGNRLLSIAAAGLLGLLALGLLLPALLRLAQKQLGEVSSLRVLALLGLLLASITLPLALGWLDPYLQLWRQANWEAIGAIGEGVVGAFGQVMVALVALLVAWQQVRVDLRLTGQQNRITQAQTIDNFIQGISQMIVDEEGLLEDWPMERLLAEGRLAAVLASIDADGKARILRFLSHSLLLSPLRRDMRLGRAILNGQGSYELDWQAGVPVVRLHAMLRGADLSRCDLRGVDLHDADLRGTNFSGSDLSDARLMGSDLSGANLEQCCLDGTRFFFGRPQTATPVSVETDRDLVTGAGSGAIVQQINLRGARRLDPQQHYYLASWSGKRSRATLPGGTRGVTSQLDRAKP